MSAASAPNGWHSVTPRIFTHDAKGLVDFLKMVFSATGDFQAERPSEIWIGDSVIMVTGTLERDPMPACLYVYLDDVDATYTLAVEAGATSIEAPVETPYGDRRAMFKDSWNNVWQIARRG